MHSISEYITEIIKVVDIVNHSWKVTPEICLFRGQPDKNYSLTPSLGRIETTRKAEMGYILHGDIAMFGTEANLLESAKFAFPDVFTDDLKPVDLLALLQHHGIPTRLFDITENPLVALYCAKYRYTKNSNPKTLCPIFTRASIRTLRQRMQSAMYILFPNKIELDEYTGEKQFIAEIQSLLKDNEFILKRLIIPQEVKSKILENLKVLGINGGTLFNDNTDKACEAIKHKFSQYE